MRRVARPVLFAALAGSMLMAGPGPVLAQQGERQGFEDRGHRRDPDRYFRANPSKVIATELAFARRAQEKGQWTAFAEFAADDAVMFVPQPVRAREWLKKQQNPVQAVRWQPHHVWSSCDGTLAVTKGAWQRPDGSVGYFTTVWERQKNHEYKWVMDQGDTLAHPLEAPEMIGAVTADCGRRGAPPADPEPAAGGQYTGRAKDGTLRWEVSVETDGARSVRVRYWDGAAWQDAISEQVAAS